MPYRKRHRRVRVSGEVLTAERRVELLTGFTFSGESEFGDERERRAAWRKHGRRLLAEWVGRYPGTRPAGWWEYDAGRKRRKFLRGKVEGKSKELYRGLPIRFLPISEEVAFESEAAFLIRNRLMGTREKGVLAEGALDPEVIHGVDLTPRTPLRSAERGRKEAEASTPGEGFYFDMEKAERPIWFILSYLKLTKGRFTSRPLRLLWYQTQIIRELFGWIDRLTGYRRFRRAAIWIPKKNSKSFLCSALGLYLAIADGEQGAEVYCASGSKEQAGIVFRECKKLVVGNPELGKVCSVTENEIRYPAMQSFIAPISARAESKEGIDASSQVWDEIHIMDQKLVNALRYATISRHQPLTIMISTAGRDDDASFGYSEYKYGLKVSRGEMQDPNYYVRLWQIEEGEDWKDLRVWERVNPGFGVTFTAESAREAITEAINKPSALPSLLRYRLNKWNRDASEYFDMEHYRACEEEFDPVERLGGMMCCAGLDLSASQDLTAMCLVFPPQEGLEKYHVLPWFWIPGHNLAEREDKDKAPFTYWVERGWVKTCEGEVISHNDVRDELILQAETYSVKEVPFDRALAAKIEADLQDAGFLTVQFSQAKMSMSQPTKDLNDLITKEEITFLRNDCLRWCFSNAVAKRDEQENVQLSKGKSTGRIDGVVATVMALARAQANEVVTVTYTPGDALVLQG